MDDMTRCELLKTISEYQFVAVELNLYLDTHPDDREAFETLQKCIRLSAEGRKRYAAARSDYLYYSTRLKELIAAYEEQYGPLMNFGHSATATGCYVCSEWPWD